MIFTYFIVFQGLADSVSALAVIAYVLADMDQRLPTNYTAPPPMFNPIKANF